MASVVIIGGGLAGSEAAWQASRFGFDVTLYEMRPLNTTPAHKTHFLAELVCSNSLRSSSLTNAVGLLKAPLNQREYTLFWEALRSADAHDPKAFEKNLFLKDAFLWR